MHSSNTVKIWVFQWKKLHHIELSVTLNVAIDWYCKEKFSYGHLWRLEGTSGASYSWWQKYCFGHITLKDIPLVCCPFRTASGNIVLQVRVCVKKKRKPHHCPYNNSFVSNCSTKISLHSFRLSCESSCQGNLNTQSRGDHAGFRPI